MSTRGSLPQPQEAVGPIVGAAVGAVIGLVGIIFAVVTLVVVFCYCQQTGNEHKKLEWVNTSIVNNINTVFYIHPDYYVYFIILYFPLYNSAVAMEVQDQSCTSESKWFIVS